MCRPPWRAETTKRHLNSTVQRGLCNEVTPHNGGIQAPRGPGGWGPAPRGQLTVTSPCTRSPPRTDEGLGKKVHQEAAVGARAEVLAVFIVDNLRPAGSTGPRREEGAPTGGGDRCPNPGITGRLGARPSLRPELPRQPKQVGSSTTPQDWLWSPRQTALSAGCGEGGPPGTQLRSPGPHSRPQGRHH